MGTMGYLYMTKRIRVTHGIMQRNGLRESLEAYASRLGLSTSVARPLWRQEGLRLLHVSEPADVRAGICAIAPGVSVPTNMVLEYLE